MVSKKKRAANKLARMSEEEKLRYLQQRAAAEEEARRRKEQLLAAFIKNKLKHEDAFSRLNSAKINQEWRQTLRQLKNNELHEAAETLHQTFDIAMHTKNKIIDTLLEDLGNSVSMHSTAVQTHLDFINKIIKICEGRLDTVEVGYGICREEKLRETKLQTERSLENFARDESSMTLDIEYQLRYHSSSADVMHNKADDFRNHYKFKALSETRREEEKGNKKIEKLKTEMKQTLKSYNKALAPFINHYKDLQESDANEMLSHLKHIKRIREIEAELKQSIKRSSLKRSPEPRMNRIKRTQEIKYLTEEHLIKRKETLERIVNEKKERLEEARRKVREELIGSEESIRKLSGISGAIVKKLDWIGRFVSLIEKSRESYRKYERENQGDSLPEWSEPRRLSQDIVKAGGEDKSSLFWRVYSRLVAEVEGRLTTHSRLLDERTALQDTLIKYMRTLARPSNLTRCLYRDIPPRTKFEQK